MKKHKMITSGWRVVLVSAFLCANLAYADYLQDALDNRNIDFTAPGWTENFSFVSPEGGGSSLKSPSIGHGESSEPLTATVDAGEIGAPLKFWWKVDAEPYDGLYLYVDGAYVARLRGSDGTTDWQEFRVQLPSGTHTIEWVYGKNSSGVAGADAGWVDNVQLDAPIVFTSKQSAVVDAPTSPSATYSVALFNYATSNLEWRLDQPGTGSFEVFGFSLSAGSWFGVFLYDNQLASYTQGQYVLPAVSNSLASEGPDWSGATLAGSPSSSLLFSGSSALCGVHVPPHNEGWALFQNYQTHQGDWKQLETPKTYALQYQPPAPGDWMGVFLYSDATGEYMPDAMYVMREDY